jgi:hypothetical protein
MAILEVMTFDVAPGRMDEFIADVRTLKQAVERVDVGLSGVRLLRFMIAGADTNKVALVFENADLVSWAESIVRESQDPAEQAAAARIHGPDSAARLVHRMLMRDLPL